MVREFCSTHDADSIYIALWDMLKYALCSAEISHWDEQKRAEYIFIFETLAQLIEASYALEDLWEKNPELYSIAVRSLRKSEVYREA
jgi:hypothetical protein